MSATGNQSWPLERALNRPPPFVNVQDGIAMFIERGDMCFICFVRREVPPLLVLEFLNRIASTFKRYFETLTEAAISKNMVTAYQLLEEMLEYGMSLVTESNVLEGLISPPSVITDIIGSITGASRVSETLPHGVLSNIPWRKVECKYLVNEFLVEVLEEIDVLVDKLGNIVTGEIVGEIWCMSRLSGVPELLLTLRNVSLIDDYTLHPCVRHTRFKQDKSISFVPPDGKFMLMSYRVPLTLAARLPIYVKSQVFLSQNTGKLDISVGQRNMNKRKIEKCSVSMMMCSHISNVNTKANCGSARFDSIGKTLHWDVGRISNEMLPMLSGNIQYGTVSDLKRDVAHTVTADFVLQYHNTSGVTVQKILVMNQDYALHESVKYTTRAGCYQFRS